MSFHYILHVTDSIKNCGPCWTSWQYPMERMCGMLLPLVHSKLHPYVNLATNIMIIEKINHLSYISSAYNKIFSKNNSNTKIWPEYRVFGLFKYFLVFLIASSRSLRSRYNSVALEEKV